MVEEKKSYKKQMPVIIDDMFGLGSSSDFSKMTEKMYSPDQIKMTTDLSEKSIGKLVKLYAYAEAYEVPLIEHLCNIFIELRVSKDRQGRDEAVSMSSAILGMKRLEGIERMIEGQTGRK
jgi:hypothetical protein